MVATNSPDIEQVIAEHGAMIRRIVATVEANPAIAQELEQEILVALWRALPSWRGASSLKTFVARIAENALDALDQARHTGLERPPRWRSLNLRLAQVGGRRNWVLLGIQPSNTKLSR